MSPILGIYASSMQPALNATSYESIATVTVGAGGSSSVSFSSIPSTYKHLQIRGIARSVASQVSDVLRIRFNSDTTSNYARHILYGTGASALSSGSASGNLMTLGSMSAATTTANSFGATVIDILDYTNTSKYKTLRALGGFDTNTTDDEVSLSSGLYFANTNAITGITIFFETGSNLAQYSSFALYGIR